MNGLTLDTGALIALERKDRRALSLVQSASLTGQVVTVPASVIVEWWRGQRGRVVKVLAGFTVEPLSLPLARLAGEALRDCGRGPSTTDAVVMASAAQRGDTVLSGDIEDLQLLQAVFPAVSVLRV